MQHTIRVVDFETTDTPDKGGKVCEIGYVDVEVDVSPVDVLAYDARVVRGTSFFVNPRVPMPPVAQAVHHISDADVIGADCWENAQRALFNEPEPFCFAAHNADFEAALFDAGDKSWICTYKTALRIWPDAPGHSNQVLRYWLQQEKGMRLDELRAMPPHRAEPDAFVTAHILAFMLNGRFVSLDDALHWSSGPPLLHRVTFGKHKGLLWSELPPDYLDWIATQSDMDNNTKANARYRLKEIAQAASQEAGRGA